MEFSHYAPMPSHIAEQVIAKAKKAQTEES
jgi:translation elongation factor EF-G